MRVLLWIAVAGSLICVPLCAQQTNAGIIHHRAGFADVLVNDPRPLFRVVAALRKEYGWLVEYEEPPFESRRVLRDVSPTEWHIAHPNAKGFLIPSGGAFHTGYPEGPDMWGSASDEERVLDRIISDYNRSGNPGKFLLRKQSNGTCLIIGNLTEDDRGKEIHVDSVLDARISIPRTTGNVETVVGLILRAVSAKTGRAMGWSSCAGDDINWSLNTTVTVGGDSVHARDLLIQMLDAPDMRDTAWNLLYEPNFHKYLICFDWADLSRPSLFDKEGILTTTPTRRVARIP